MVALGVGLDKRIGRSHLDPLLGKIPRKSPCLPKDLQAFNSFLKNKGLSSKLFEAAYEFGVMEK
jgi:UDP-glucose 6-dehydrogenase